MKRILWSAVIVASGAASGAAMASEQIKTFNVRDFGAAGDGVHDDTSAILAAIEEAGRAGGGGVLLPPSDKPYLITDSIHIAFSHVHLVGTGATVLLKDGAGRGRTDPNNYLHTVYVAGTPDRPIEDVSVTGLTIDANYWGQGGTGGSWQASAAVAGHPRGLQVNYARNVLVDKVTIRRTFVGLTFGFGSFDCEARDTTVTLWHHDGFGASPGLDATDGGCGNIRFIRCRAVDALNGMQGGLPGERIKGWEVEDGVHDVYLEDCLVENTGGGGFFVRLHGADNQVVSNVEFVRCRVRNISGGGWFIRGWRHTSRLKNVRLIDCESDASVAILMGAEDISIQGGRYNTTMSIGFYWDYLSNLPNSGLYERLPARSVRVEGATITKVVVNAQKGNDGVEEYTPSIALVDLKTTDGISILSPNETDPGIPSPVRIQNCRLVGQDKPLAWHDLGVRPYDPVPTLEMPTYVVSRCQLPPLIDGSNADDCWARQNNYADLSHNVIRPEVIRGQSLLRASYDDQGLYLLAECLEQNMEHLHAAHRNPDDDDIWNDDCVEFIMHRQNDPPDHFRKWIINASGAVFDSDSTGVNWNSNAKSAVRRYKDRYIIELSIPWKDLGGSPAHNELIKANFVRSKAAVRIPTNPGTRWAWSWQYLSSAYSFSDTTLMGLLQLN